MCQGRVPPRPMTPFRARATTRVIGGRFTIRVCRAQPLMPSGEHGRERRSIRCPCSGSVRTQVGRHRSSGHRAVADRLARTLSRQGAGDRGARLYRGSRGDHPTGGRTPGAARPARRQYVDGRRRHSVSRWLSGHSLTAPHESHSLAQCRKQHCGDRIGRNPR